MNTDLKHKWHIALETENSFGPRYKIVPTKDGWQLMRYRGCEYRKQQLFARLSEALAFIGLEEETTD